MKPEPDREFAMPNDQILELCGRGGGVEDADDEEYDIVGDSWSEDGGSFKPADTEDEEEQEEVAEEENYAGNDADLRGEEQWGKDKNARRGNGDRTVAEGG